MPQPTVPAPSRARRASYWLATILVALAFLSGGAAYVLGVEVPLRGMAALGYPAYFVTLLGIWKLLGGLALLAPGLPRLKEWAYAGVVFDLTGAMVSHAAMGEGSAKLIAPVVLLALTVTSWTLRPPSRALGRLVAEAAAT